MYLCIYLCICYVLFIYLCIYVCIHDTYVYSRGIELDVSRVTIFTASQKRVLRLRVYGADSFCNH